MWKKIKLRSRVLSLSDYYMFFVFILLSILAVSAFYYHSAYENYKMERKTALEIATFRIHGELKEIFRENATILKYVSGAIDKIKGPPKKMLEEIARKLSVPGELGIRAMAASYISWADPSGAVVVSGRHGILGKDAPSIANRKYLEPAKKEPGVLKTAALTRSLFTTDVVLPIAMGVENSEKVFLGYLLVGLRIKNLRSHLEERIDKLKIDFIIIDNDRNIIVSPPNLNINKSVFDPIFSHENSSKESLETPILINNVAYSQYKKLKNYPYTVVIGYNEDYRIKKLHDNVLTKLYQFITLAVFCIVFIFFFKKIIINPISALSKYASLISTSNTNMKMPKQNSLEMHNLAKGLLLVNRYFRKTARYRKRLELAENIASASDHAKDEFVKSLYKDFEHPLKTILNYTDILLDSSSKGKHLKLTNDQEIDCINKIKAAALQINYKTFTSLDLIDFDINELLEQCVQINLKEAFSKKIKISTSLQENIPNINADKLKIKQIVVGIIYESINNLPNLSEIQVSSRVVTKEHTKYAEIIIKDNGFGLDEEEIHRIQHNLGINESLPFLNVTPLSSGFIKKVVEMHKGKYHLHSKRHEGTVVTITLPIHIPNYIPEDPDIKESKVSNVHYLLS